MTPRDFTFRYHSAAHWVHVFRICYGPVHRAFAALAPDAQAELERDLVALVNEFNVSGIRRWWCLVRTLEVVVACRH